MESISQCVEKLSSLLQMGVITPEEFEQRRQKLVDDFVGSPMPLPGAEPSRGVRRAPNHAIPLSIAAPSRGPYSMPPYLQLAGLPGGLLVVPPAPGPMLSGVGRGAQRFAPYAKPRGPSNSILVHPIPDATTVEDLKQIFSHLGAASVAIIRHGSPRHAYVNFATPHEAAAAVAAGPVKVHGQMCLVALSSRPRPVVAEGEPTNGIGIFNIPFTMSQEEVRSMLVEFPGFQHLKYISNKNGQFRGYVFAYFDAVENAAYAKGQLLGLSIGDQVLDVKFANKTEMSI